MSAMVPEDIPLCAPEIGGNEWAYVKECLDTGWVSSVGAFVERFERVIADTVGAKHAVATMNGTSALHIALLLAGVRPDDEVLVSSLTFIAPANAIRYLGAWPVFVDAEPRYWQMDPGLVLDFLAQGCTRREGELVNLATGRRVGGILAVDALGHPVDLDPLLEAARTYRIPLVEDATESLGASYRGKPVGHLAEVACFSFNGNKLITTGGGGMLVTNNEAWARRAKYLTTQAKDDPIEFIHGDVGYNYRLTNVQAAIGVAQMERLVAHVAAKRRIAERYADAFADVPGITPMQEAPWASSVFWMYTMLVDEGRFGLGSRELIRILGQRGIQSRPLWQPLHQSAPHRGSPTLGGSVAERLNRTAVSLPCSVGLSTEAQDSVIRCVLEARRSARRGTPQLEDAEGEEAKCRELRAI
jgi:perosamine synthetase